MGVAAGRTLISAMAAVVVAVLGIAGTAEALDLGPLAPTVVKGHVEPEVETGNSKCNELDPGWSELKIEPKDMKDNETYTSGPLEFTIKGFTSTTESFDWESNIGVDAVFVKSGNGGNLYRYEPEETSDEDLVPPYVKNDEPEKGYKEISHVSVCYDDDGETTGEGDPDDGDEPGDGGGGGGTTTTGDTPADEDDGTEVLGRQETPPGEGGTQGLPSSGGPILPIAAIGTVFLGSGFVLLDAKRRLIARR